MLGGAFHDAGPKRQSAFPVEIASLSVRVDLVGADADRDGFGPAAARRRSGDDLSNLPGVQAVVAKPRSKSLRIFFLSKSVRRATSLIERPARFSSCNTTIFQDRVSKISAMQKLVDEAFESGVSNKSLDNIWAAAKRRAQADLGN